MQIAHEAIDLRLSRLLVCIPWLRDSLPVMMQRETRDCHTNPHCELHVTSQAVLTRVVRRAHVAFFLLRELSRERERRVPAYTCLLPSLVIAAHDAIDHLIALKSPSGKPRAVRQVSLCNPVK